MSKKIIVPPEQDPIKFFQRYRRKKIWQRRDWIKGVQIGAIVVGAIATLLKIFGVL